MKKYFLSICAIVRNEAPYIAEWIEFHKLQGVEHFYIYHNSRASKGNLGMEDLETYYALVPYIEDITFTVWPDFPGQFTAYNDCLRYHGHESEWIAFIDVDEFLWCPCGYKYQTALSVSSMLYGRFNDPTIAVVAPHWVLFGSNGEKEKTDGLVTQRFIRRQTDVNPHCKSIVRPELVGSVGKNPHTFRVKPESNGALVSRIVDERGNTLPEEYAVLPDGSADILRINHYHTKSYAEYCSRRAYPTPDKAFLNTNIEESFKAHDCNEVEDTRVRDLYAEKIKEALHGS